MFKSTYSISDLTNAVINSHSYQEVGARLGLQGKCHSHLAKIVNRHNIDISHFKGRGFHGCELEDILVENSEFLKTGHLRNKLYKAGLKEPGCEECGLETWRDKPIQFHLHHRNGRHSDNRLENLQILCPLCHSQTDNYGVKNKGQGRKRD
jgi:hypothetical protein